jgi:hypothetical protein
MFSVLVLFVYFVIDSVVSVTVVLWYSGKILMEFVRVIMFSDPY